jgi:hypothetical protein
MHPPLALFTPVFLPVRFLLRKESRNLFFLCSTQLPKPAPPITTALEHRKTRFSDFGVLARFTLPPIEGGRHGEAVANFGKYVGKRRSPGCRIEKKAEVSDVSEILADAMVAKSELLEHYEETSALQANTDSGVPSTGAQYLNDL